MGLNMHDHPAQDSLGNPHEHHHGPIQQMPMELDRPLEDQGQFDGHAHTGLGAHEHGEHTHQHFHQHDTGWQSFVLRSHDLQDAEKLKAAVREVTLQEPILRAKGFASIEGKDHQLVVQAVRNRVQTYYGQTLSHDSHSSLVVIGYHPRRDQITKLMNELTNTEWR
jgi:cobalamin biosynthesis protein CobW